MFFPNGGRRQLHGFSFHKRKFLAVRNAEKAT
jgi:hypothetical protein